MDVLPVLAAELAADVYRVQDSSTVKAFLARPEFTKDKQEKRHLVARVGFRIANVSDGFGVCVLGGKGYENDVFLIFRGSTTANDGADWVSNARVGVEYSKTGLPVHIGFNHIFTSMLPDIQNFLAAHPFTGTVHCIGHSLGGAVATLCSDWVSSQYGNPVKVYTFGAPRPGLPLFSWMYTNRFREQNIYRVYHATDPVPMIPLFPFIHAPVNGTGHYIHSEENILSPAAHDIDKYVDSVSRVGWDALKKRTPPYWIDAGIEQWLDDKFPVNPAHPMTWRWIDAAMKYVVSKIFGGLIMGIQFAASGVITVVDTLAWMLMKGIELTEYVSGLVYKLIIKIMQALSITVLKTEAEITQMFLRELLQRLVNRLNQEAMRALRNTSF